MTTSEEPDARSSLSSFPEQPNESMISVTTSVTTSVTPSSTSEDNIGKRGHEVLEDSTVSVTTSVTPSFPSAADPLNNATVTPTSNVVSTIATTITIRTSVVLQTDESLVDSFASDPAFNVTEQFRELSVDKMAPNVTLDDEASNVTLHVNSSDFSVAFEDLHVNHSHVTLATEHLFIDADENQSDFTPTTPTTFEEKLEGHIHSFEEKVEHQIQATETNRTTAEDPKHHHHQEQNMTSEDPDHPEMFQADDVIDAPFPLQNVTTEAPAPFRTDNATSAALDVTYQHMPDPEATDEALPAAASLNEDDWFKIHHSRALHRYYHIYKLVCSL